MNLKIQYAVGVTLIVIFSIADITRAEILNIECKQECGHQLELIVANKQCKLAGSIVQLASTNIQRAQDLNLDESEKNVLYSKYEEAQSEFLVAIQKELIAYDEMELSANGMKQLRKLAKQQTNLAKLEYDVDNKKYIVAQQMACLIRKKTDMETTPQIADKEVNVAFAQLVVAGANVYLAEINEMVAKKALENIAEINVVVAQAQLKSKEQQLVLQKLRDQYVQEKSEAHKLINSELIKIQVVTVIKANEVVTAAQQLLEQAISKATEKGLKLIQSDHLQAPQQSNQAPQQSIFDLIDFNRDQQISLVKLKQSLQTSFKSDSVNKLFDRHGFQNKVETSLNVDQYCQMLSEIVKINTSNKKTYADKSAIPSSKTEADNTLSAIPQ